VLGVPGELARWGELERHSAERLSFSRSLSATKTTSPRKRVPERHMLFSRQSIALQTHFPLQTRTSY